MSYTNTVMLLVKRLWQNTCLRAAGVSKVHLESGKKLIVEASKKVDLSNEGEAIKNCLYDHIRNYTVNLLMTSFCPTCKKAAEECSIDKQCCGDYVPDPAAIKAGTEQLMKAIELLNGVYGFDASSFSKEIDELLNEHPSAV